MFADRIKMIRERRGWSQEDLARLIGVSPSAVGNWESKANKPSNRTLGKIAEKLEVSIPYLLGETEENSGMVMNETIGKYQSNPNLRESKEGILMRKVPVISWAHAGESANYYDVEHFLQEEVPSDCPDPLAYSLIVEGDSMEPAYKAGDRLVVSPSEEPMNGDVVVARVEESGEVFFKLYHLNGKNLVRLSSYNPIYPVLEFSREDFRFIQPVYGMFRKARTRR
jgi:phage repressor protein C with HTH and peptisase S24 domain